MDIVRTGAVVGADAPVLTSAPVSTRGHERLKPEPAEAHLSFCETGTRNSANFATGRAAFWLVRVPGTRACALSQSPTARCATTPRANHDLMLRRARANHQPSDSR
jgi:hypothetical protein